LGIRAAWHMRQGMAGGGLSLLLVLCAALASGGQVGPTDLTAVDDQLVELLSIESAPKAKAKPKKGKGKKGGMPPGHKKIVDPRGSKSVNRYISKGTSLTPSQVKESAAKKHFSATAMAAAEVHTFSTTAVLMKTVKEMNFAGVDAGSFMLTRAKKGEKRRPACKKYPDCLSTFSGTQCGKGKLLSQLGLPRNTWKKVGTEKANCTESAGGGGEQCLIFNEVFAKIESPQGNLLLKMESMNNGTSRAVVIPPFKAAKLGHCQDKCKGFLQNTAVLKMAEPNGPLDKGGKVKRRAVLHYATKQRCKCCDFEGFLPGFNKCEQYRFVNGTMTEIPGTGVPGSNGTNAWKPMPGQTASKACPGPPPPPPPKRKPKLPKAKKIKKTKIEKAKRRANEKNKEEKKIAAMTPEQKAAEIKKIENEGPNPAKSTKKKKKKKDILDELIPFMQAPKKEPRPDKLKGKKKSTDKDPFNFFPAIRRRRSKISNGTRRKTSGELKKKGSKPKKAAKKNELAVNKAKKKKKKPSKKAVKRVQQGKTPKKKPNKKVRKDVHLKERKMKPQMKPYIDPKKAKKAGDKATKKKP